ncbi:MAG TPA: MmgE/PrpD family protein [Stellaceae bacterium]|jgi:2-methylcitrate dehydratase PrpD|nr:MmgE/PrpD family protein [Stellaceae bacterium]
MTDTPPSTRLLADFVAASRWEDIPAPVRREGVRSLLNTIGCSLGGAGDEAMEIAIRALSPYFGPAQARVIGRRERPDALSAAFLNALSANVLEYDDTYLPTVMHPAAPVGPALFAIAERRQVSGAALVHAFILGVETSCRVGNALMPNHYRRGYHITASCGIFGAAAASAKLLGLNPDQTRWALGHAATQSAGLVESLGSMSKSLGVGNSAKNGLAAALLAAEGFTGAEHAIEGKYGFANVTSETIDLGKITGGIGEDWQILQNAYKPYPCGVVLFPVIDACLDLRADHAPAPDGIRRVVVRGHSLLLERTDRPVIHNGRDAKVSLQHSVAVAFLSGAAGLAEYEDERVADPAVRALAARVEAIADDTVPVESAYVTVETAAGTLEHHIRHGRGTPGRPMSDAELDAKVRGLIAFGSPFVDADRLIAAVRGIEGEADASGIVAMTVPG